MPTVDCRVGADCASGVCLRDGTCQPVAVSDAGQTDAGMQGVDGGSVDAGEMDAGTDAGQVDSGMPVGCQPNHDGVIERSEVVFQPGLHATFKVSGATTFSTAGTDGGHWDFTGNLTGDASRLVETRAVQGQWFEADYPDAGYVAELGQGSDLLGVFAATSDALYLQGVVSPADGLTSTRVFYTPWVKVLKFPLAQGDSWSTDTSVTGRYNGAVIGFALPVQSELYEMNVDRRGDAVTPYATFDVLRVRTKMTRSLAFVPSIIIRSYSWNTECFGTVASVSSTNNETSTEFTSATEVRRLSP